MKSESLYVIIIMKYILQYLEQNEDQFKKSPHLGCLKKIKIKTVVWIVDR